MNNQHPPKSSLIHRFLSAPLWVKIMGIVVAPALLALAALAQASPGALPLPALAGAFLAGLVFSFGLSRILARPLRQLLEVIRRVEGGDLAARAPVWADDEIGQVQQAFNRMTARLQANEQDLRQRNQDLTAINDLAAAIARGDDPAVLLPAALESLAALFDAALAAVDLLAADRQTLRRCAAFGDIPAALAELPAEQTPTRQVLDGAQAILLEDAPALGRYPRLAEALSGAGICAWVCAPVISEGKTIGAICLGLRRPHRFSARETALLEVTGALIGDSLYHTRLLEDLRHNQDELRHALRRAVELQEEERKRLARELHDEVGQALTSILIRLKALQEEDDLETIVDRLDGLRYLTAETTEELRRMAMDLRPAALDNLGLAPALAAYAHQCSERSGRQVAFSGPAKSERLPPETEISLYRIAQEGIANAIRHGQAQQVHVSLDRLRGAIHLMVEDDGQGFSPGDHERGLGLVGVRERVELLGGAWGIDSAPGSGTRLWVEIPFKDGGKE